MKVLVADDHEFVRGGLVSELTDMILDASFLEAGDASGVLDILAAIGSTTRNNLAVINAVEHCNK